MIFEFLQLVKITLQQILALPYSNALFQSKNIKQLLNNWEMFPFTEENSTPHILRVSILYQYHNTQYF